MTDHGHAAAGKGSLLDVISSRFEAVVIGCAHILLIVVIAAVVLELFSLMYTQMSARLSDISSVADLQRTTQGAFGGVLLILLGLELLESLRTYFTEHRIRLELILVAATIAVGRHVILIDLEHTEGFS